jgi:hypothetical protein
VHYVLSQVEDTERIRREKPSQNSKCVLKIMKKKNVLEIQTFSEIKTLILLSESRGNKWRFYGTTDKGVT